MCTGGLFSQNVSKEAGFSKKDQNGVIGQVALIEEIQNICSDLITSDIDSTLNLVDLALGKIGMILDDGSYSDAIDKRLLYNKAELIALKAEANLYLSNHEDALKLYQKSLEVYQALGGSRRKEVAVIYMNVGILYFQFGQYEEALYYDKKSLDIHLAQKDTINIPKIYNNIANIYLVSDQYKKAVIWHKKSLDFFLKHPSSLDQTVLSYSNLGIDYLYMDDYDMAHAYYLQAYSVVRHSPNKYLKILVNTNFADYFVHLFQDGKKVERFAAFYDDSRKSWRTSILDSADYYARRALRVSDLWENSGYKQYAYFALSQVYLFKGDKSRAKVEIENTLLWSKKNNSLQIEREAYRLKYLLAIKNKNHDLAMQMIDKYTTMSIQNKQRNLAISHVAESRRNKARFRVVQSKMKNFFAHHFYKDRYYSSLEKDKKWYNSMKWIVGIFMLLLLSTFVALRKYSHTVTDLAARVDYMSNLKKQKVVYQKNLKIDMVQTGRELKHINEIMRFIAFREISFEELAATGLQLNMVNWPLTNQEFIGQHFFNENKMYLWKYEEKLKASDALLCNMFEKVLYYLVMYNKMDNAAIIIRSVEKILAKHYDEDIVKRLYPSLIVVDTLQKEVNVTGRRLLVWLVGNVSEGYEEMVHYDQEHVKGLYHVFSGWNMDEVYSHQLKNDEVIYFSDKQNMSDELIKVYRSIAFFSDNRHNAKDLFQIDELGYIGGIRAYD